MQIAHSKKNVIVCLLFHLDRCAIVIEFTSLKINIRILIACAAKICQASRTHIAFTEESW